jgi:signal peptidase I
LSPTQTVGKKPKSRKTTTPSGVSGRHSATSSGIRELIESVAVAFVLAFLFRTFEAEAFVIPTGSMAPTLMGRHKDLTCPKCGYGFQVSASEEVDQYGNSKGADYLIEGCTCPMCRYAFDISNTKKYPSFWGDRILVAKFAYQFQEPKPWDVVVFHYPGDAELNYIKRLVGVPNETIRIQYGDIRVKGPGDDDFYIMRKSPDKLLAMLQPVFDNDLMPKLADYGYPARWTAWPAADESNDGQWQSADNCQTYQTDGQAADVSWLRYRHLVPDTEDWADVEQLGRLSPGTQLQAELITDYSGYNTSREAASLRRKDFLAVETQSQHWVGDLALQCTVEVQSDQGLAVFELVKGGRRFQCLIDVSNGEATLLIDGQNTLEFDGWTYNSPPPAKTAFRGKGKHEVRFTNCDEQLLLWVDGSLVRFQGDTAYPFLQNTQPMISEDRADDLAPVAVGSRGAALHVSHLKIMRDIYYIAMQVEKQSNQNGHRISPQTFYETALDKQSLSNPATWDTIFDSSMAAEFPLGPDEFLVLGDNSARSKDSRLWEQDGFPFYVKRDLLIGEALYIYWPHSWDRPVPYFPNFARMHFVR